MVKGKPGGEYAGPKQEYAGVVGPSVVIDKRNHDVYIRLLISKDSGSANLLETPYHRAMAEMEEG